MPKKTAAPEAPAASAPASASASKVKKATTPRKSASSSPAAAAAAAAAPAARPSYYNERPTVAAVRATLPQPSGLGKSLRDQYFRTPLSEPTETTRVCPRTRSSLSNILSAASFDLFLFSDWELLTGCYSLEPWEKIAFSASSLHLGLSYSPISIAL